MLTHTHTQRDGEEIKMDLQRRLCSQQNTSPVVQGRGDRLLWWQLIDTSTWAVHSLSVVPVGRFVGGSPPATRLMGQGSWPVDLPKYDQLTQIIGVREPWQLQYDERWEQLLVTCGSSGGEPLCARRRCGAGAALSPRPPRARPPQPGPNQTLGPHGGKTASQTEAERNKRD